MDFTTDPAPRERARAFAEREIVPTVVSRDRESRWERALFAKIGASGLFADAISLAEGAPGASADALLEALAGFGEGSLDAGLSAALSAHAFGCAVPLCLLGTRAQRERYLPLLASGEAIGTLAHREQLTEPAPTGVQTVASRTASGWSLRGKKTWVVNGPVADVLVVTAVTDPARGKGGVSAFLVPMGTPGLSVRPQPETVGLHTAAIAEITLDDCQRPDESRLGPEGEGLTGALALALRWERTYFFAPWLGLMKALVERSVARAREGAHLGRLSSQSQTVRATLADMRLRYELSRRMAGRAAFRLSQGLSERGSERGSGGGETSRAEGDADIASSALYLAESASFVARSALLLRPLLGAEVDPLTARLYRDAAAAALLAGASDVLRSALASSLLDLG